MVALVVMFYDTKKLWEIKALAKPIRLWVYAVAVDSAGGMEVVGMAGPVVYELGP